AGTPPTTQWSGTCLVTTGSRTPSVHPAELDEQDAHDDQPHPAERQLRQRLAEQDPGEHGGGDDPEGAPDPVGDAERHPGGERPREQGEGGEIADGDRQVPAAVSRRGHPQGEGRADLGDDRAQEQQPAHRASVPSCPSSGSSGTAWISSSRNSSTSPREP